MGTMLAPSFSEVVTAAAKDRPTMGSNVPARGTSDNQTVSKPRFSSSTTSSAKRSRSRAPSPAETAKRIFMPRRSALQPVDDGAGELRGLDLGGPFHLTGEVVGDDLVRDGGLQRRDDLVSGRMPP